MTSLPIASSGGTQDNIPNIEIKEEKQDKDLLKQQIQTARIEKKYENLNSTKITGEEKRNIKEVKAQRKGSVMWPLKPGKAIQTFREELTDFEKGEILDFKKVYYLGQNCTSKKSGSK